jgi:hypothetical protein
MDLVTNHQTGKLRETALFSVLCKAAVLWAYIKYVTSQNYETMTAVASGILIAHEVVKAYQNQQQQKLDKANVEPSRPL